MSRQLRFVILANALVVLLFGFFSYVLYTTFGSPFEVSPASIFYYYEIQAKETAFYSYALLTFVFSTIMNLYFIIDMQGRHEKNEKSQPT